MMTPFISEFDFSEEVNFPFIYVSRRVSEHHITVLCHFTKASCLYIYAALLTYLNVSNTYTGLFITPCRCQEACSPSGLQLAIIFENSQARIRGVYYIGGLWIRFIPEAGRLCLKQLYISTDEFIRYR